ncbi:hypothetical protein GO730_17685 [Spirosoma sp. HMF3257]|uniref:hypothetical protein n=1 Tax=Spirosoma telluris TaxID=2183553 RepID=UPI0011B93E6C|nr:hypothetical protein [Spirosoma telluris]
MSSIWSLKWQQVGRSLSKKSSRRYRQSAPDPLLARKISQCATIRGHPALSSCPGCVTDAPGRHYTGYQRRIGYNTALCTELTTQGHQLVVLTFPTGISAARQSFPAGITERKLPDHQEETIQRTLSQLPASVSQVIYLHPRLTTPIDVQTFAVAQEKGVLKTVFFLAKYVKQSLNAGNWQTRPTFLTVTRQDGALGTANSGGMRF